MLRSTLKVALIALVLCFAASNAYAFGHHRGWGGGCGYGGCGYGGCGYGGYGGWYGGYGGYGWGYGGGWYGGWGYGSYRTSLGYLANTAAQGAVTANNSAILTISVPADAKIFVNDRATTSTGANRSYISRDLQPGGRYTYRVRAEFVRDGQPVSEEQTVKLTAGENQSLAFGAGKSPTPAATASLR